MTPYQMARAECANMDTDGNCLLVERREVHGYSVPLPDWLPAGRWRELVEAARADGERVVCVRLRAGPGGGDVVRQTAADRQRALGLPVAERLRLGRRHDLCFCPKCGARIGCEGRLPEELPDGTWDLGTLCGDCTVAADGADATCKVKRRRRCSYFEQAILPLAYRPSPKENPKLQGERARAREAYWSTGEAAVVSEGRRPRAPRSCPDCGGPLPKGRRYCEPCAAKRRKATYRRSRRETERPAQQLSGGQRSQVLDIKGPARGRNRGSDRRAESGRDGQTTVAPERRGNRS